MPRGYWGFSVHLVCSVQYECNDTHTAYTAILKQYNIGSSAQTKTSFSHVVLLSGTTCTVITSVLWISLLALRKKTEVRNLAEIQPWLMGFLFHSPSCST